MVSSGSAVQFRSSAQIDNFTNYCYYPSIWLKKDQGFYSLSSAMTVNPITISLKKIETTLKVN